MNSPYERTRHRNLPCPPGTPGPASSSARIEETPDGGFTLLNDLLCACEQAWQGVCQGIAARQSDSAGMRPKLRSFRLDVPLAPLSTQQSRSVQVAVTDLAEASLRIEFFGLAGDASCFASAIVDFEDSTGRLPVALSHQARNWLKKRMTGVRCRRGSYLVPGDSH